jgi:segregation and condensation protein B
VQITDKFYQHFEIDQLPQLRPKGSTASLVDDTASDDEAEFEPAVDEAS